MALSKTITICTTLPFPTPLSSEREELHTERLIIRAPTEEDLLELHILRSQPEVMAFTRLGVPDSDLEAAQAVLDSYLSPNDVRTYTFIILSRGTGQLVGIGGIYYKSSSDLGWPEIGYMFRRETWGQGYATEFLKVWLKSWWKLPRYEVSIKVHRKTIRVINSTEREGGNESEGDAEEQLTVLERLSAITEVRNIASRRVLEKCGFKESFRYISEDDKSLIAWLSPALSKYT